MPESPKNFAYIDGANLHKGVGAQRWNLDYKRFRVWLAEKHSVGKAFIFLGYIPKQKDYYEKLRDIGYIPIFKKVTYDRQGKLKGNCDADLVLKAARDLYKKKFSHAFLVSSDGDYASLIKAFQAHGKCGGIISPANKNKCSILLKQTEAPTTFMNDIRTLVEIDINKKAPDADGTAQGSFSW